MCLRWIGCLFSRDKKSRYILDGPGMVNIPQWESFELSRSDSYYSYNFDFTVQENGVCGTCRDEEGEHTVEVPVPLKAETLRQLRALGLDELSVEQAPDDSLPVPLDESVIILWVTYPGGRRVKKAIGGDLSMQIFALLSPYIVKR